VRLQARRPQARTGLWQRALAQLADPLVLLRLVAAAIATSVWLLDGRHGWPRDAVVIWLVVVLNAVLGLRQEAKADHAVAALARMTAVTSSVLRGGQLQRIPSADLVRGDLLVLAEGDAVGADVRLVEAAALHLQEASLTSESQAVVQGSGRALVTATGMDSEMGAIATLLDTTTAAPTPLQREIARLSRSLGLAAAVIAAVVVGTVLAMSATHTPADLVRMLLLGVSLAVAVVPEGLPAILSVVLAMGVQRMAGRQAIVKTLAAVETLGSASVIASDKTGPLHAEQTAVLSGGSLASNADLRQTADGTWEIQGDPTEAAFLVAERKLGIHTRRTTRFERIAELPFTSDRKRMSTIARDHDHGDARVLITKGAPDVLLGCCTQARVGLETVPLDDTRRGWSWPTTTSPPSYTRCARGAACWTTSASSCAICCRRTWARC
jgi:P-type E1-E2 ATPase